MIPFPYAIALATRRRVTTPFIEPLTDPFFSDVVLLLHMNSDMGFADSSISSKTVTLTGNAAISTVQSRYGGASGFFDGNDAANTAITLADSVDWHMPGRFTIEFWIYPTAYKASGSWLIQQSDGIGTPCPIRIDLTTTGAITVFGSSDNSTWLFTTGLVTGDNAAPVNTWTHVALSDDGTTCRLFINGTVVASRATWTRVDNTNILRIGGAFTSGDREFQGYIDELRITKNVARYTSNFTLPTLASPDATVDDPYFTSVNLLMHMNGSNGSANFVDNSLFPRTFTVFGAPQISTVQSKFGGASAFFDGVDDYLQVSGTPLLPASSDWTIEAWCFRSVINANHQIYSQGDAGKAGRTFLLIANDVGFENKANLFVGSTSNLLMYSTSTIPASTWTHIAATRQGNTFRLFINGVKENEAVLNQAIDQTSLNLIGRNEAAANPRYFNGYIDDLRITRNVARYTANFTPPIAQLPDATPGDSFYANVPLLMRMNGTNASTTFIDSSGTRRTLTAAGSAQISTVQSKYGGASGLVGGATTANKVTAATSTDLAMGSGPFTIEFWVYMTAYSATQGDILAASGGTFQFNGTTGLHYYAFSTTTGVAMQWWSGTAGASIDSPVSLNIWTHIAFCYDGNGTMRAYRNGTLQQTVNTPYVSPTTTPSLAIGSYPGKTDGAAYAFSGYIDDLRITKGVNRYATTFTSPQLPLADWPAQDPHFSNVSLLLHFDGPNTSTTFIDSSPSKKTVTPTGNAQISTVQSKFGGSSALFDGAGDYLSIASDTDLHLLSGNFTIEAWIRIINTALVVDIANKWVEAGNQRSYTFVYTGGNQIGIAVSYDGINQSATTLPNWTPTANVWYHVAAVRNGNLLNVYVDGVLLGSSPIVSGAFSSTAPLEIGGSLGWARSSNAYIDDLRITKGIARYGTFTPPITDAEFNSSDPHTASVVLASRFDDNTVIDPFASSVVLGLHMEGANSSTTFIDTSGKVLTAAGTAAISTDVSKFGGTSGKFNTSTANRVTAAAHSDFALGGAPFTIEFWVYPTAYTVSGGRIVSAGGGAVAFNATTGIHWLCQTNSNGFEFQWWTGSTVNSLSTTLSLNVWANIAVTYDGTTIRVFKDGALASSQAGTVAQPSTTPSLAINGIFGEANGAGNTFTGYLDDIRITKGVARYTSAFTPATVPFGSFKDLKSNDLQIYGVPVINTTIRKYGAGSLQLGSNRGLTVADSSALRMGSSDFTCEAWFYLNALPANNATATIVQKGSSNNNTAEYELFLFQDATVHKIAVNVSTTGSSATRVIDFVYTAPLSTWIHVALVRRGNTFTLFVDGINRATGSFSGTLFASTTPLGIGFAGTLASSFLDGYIDDVRITKDVARYTSNFVPPLAPLPDA